MRINPFFIPVIFIGLMLGTVFAAQLFGLWSTSGRTSVNLESFKPEDIKGWMTLQQISDGVGIPLKDVYLRANIPQDVPADTAVKDLEGVLAGFETSTLREVLALEAQPAVEPMDMPVLKPTAQPEMAATQKVTGTHMINGMAITPTPLSEGQVLPAADIKGRMTIREVSASCAVPLEALLDALKLPASKADTAIKDLIAAGDMTDITVIKEAAAKLQ
jgi:hypothetical protein